MPTREVCGIILIRLDNVVKIRDKLKVAWQGTIESVQPRIRLMRSFDERSHTYLGYVLLLKGTVDRVSQDFIVAISKAAQVKHGFKFGDQVEGMSEPVSDERQELANYYKASKLRILDRTSVANEKPPPWTGIVPDLETYRQRGHRRLAARTYDLKCQGCIWGCKMPVEIIIDHWNPSKRKFRFETFCYGPKSCSFYSQGPTRKVPGRQGMTWEEEDWIDDEATAHRSQNE